MDMWEDKRGHGHLILITRHISLLYTGKEGKSKSKISFAKNLIANYITEVLMKYTTSDELFDYFNNVFIKNVDRWGFLMINLKLYTFLGQNSKEPNEAAENIRTILIEYLFAKPNDIINVESALAKLSQLRFVY